MMKILMLIALTAVWIATKRTEKVLEEVEEVPDNQVREIKAQRDGWLEANLYLMNARRELNEKRRQR